MAHKTVFSNRNKSSPHYLMLILITNTTIYALALVTGVTLFLISVFALLCKTCCFNANQFFAVQAR